MKKKQKATAVSIRSHDQWRELAMARQDEIITLKGELGKVQSERDQINSLRLQQAGEISGLRLVIDKAVRSVIDRRIGVAS